MGVLGHALGGCGEAGSSSDRKAGPPPSKPVEIERVVAEEVRSTLRLPGVVEADARIELAFRVSGFVSRVFVDEGDSVVAGTVLAELDPVDLERRRRSTHAVLARARVEVEEARRARERQESLLARNATSNERAERAVSEHERARAALREAEVEAEASTEDLARAVLRAPIDGVVEMRLIEAHEQAVAGQTVFVVVDLDPARVRAAVPDARVPDLRKGTIVRIRTPLVPGGGLEGTIERIAVAADPVARTVPFEVTAPNPDHALLPRSVVEVEVPLGRADPLALVPVSAVLRDVDTTPFCFVAVMDGDALRAERRPIGLGSVYGERIVVHEGLDKGDAVVVRGQHLLRVGDRIHVVAD